MSELEKLQRTLYQRKRNILIIIQAVIAAVLIFATLLSGVICAIVDKETYIGYQEKGTADYKVYLGENQFYTEEYLDKDHAYIASLIDYIAVDFAYNLKMDANNVNCKYSYKIDTQVQIKDKSGAALYDPTYEIKPLTTVENSGSGLAIRENVKIDYSTYNDLVYDYLNEYQIRNTTNLLVVRMYVDVLGVSDNFVEDNKNQYVVEVSVPLGVTTLNIQSKSTVPTADQKILVKNDLTATVFRVLSFVLGALSLLMVIFTVCFIILSRDKHIDYARKVKGVLNNYRSYIQRINNSFDTEGYQVLWVATIKEMLEIRDTLQMPILMYENEDRTCSQFFIVSRSNIMYLFEIKVEEPQEYDEPEEEPLDYIPLEEEVAVDDIPEPEEVADEGVEVIGVAWPESIKKNKIYRYDPDGEELNKGDTVLVPTVDKTSNIEVIREATVVHPNYKVAPESLPYPLKKIIRVIKRAMIDIITPNVSEDKVKGKNKKTGEKADK